MNSNLRIPSRPKPIFHSIDEFDVIREIGCGAFAKVYEASHKATRVKYAIKRVFLAKLCSSDQKNIQTELEIHSKIAHKHIVRFFDFFVDDRTVNIVLELLPQGNLYKYMKKTALTDFQMRSVFHQVCLSVEYLHSQNIILRDLKPENILIDSFLNVKICDFGWATHVNDAEYCQSRAGTFSYMSPESLRGQKQTVKSDIWSLGILLYEMIHGREPYQGENCMAQLLKIKTEKLQFTPRIDEDAKNLILALLKVSPNDRPAISLLFKSKFLYKLQNSPVPTATAKSVTQTKLSPEKPVKRPVLPPLQLRSQFPMLELKKEENCESKLTKQRPRLESSPNFLFESKLISSKPLTPTHNSQIQQSQKGHKKSPTSFNVFLERYASSKSPTPKELTQSLIEKVLSPSPNLLKSNLEFQNKLYVRPEKSPQANSRANVFFDFNRSSSQTALHKSTPSADISQFNQKAFEFRKNLNENTMFPNFINSHVQKVRGDPNKSPTFSQTLNLINQEKKKHRTQPSQDCGNQALNKSVTLHGKERSVFAQEQDQWGAQRAKVLLEKSKLGFQSPSESVTTKSTSYTIVDIKNESKDQKIGELMKLRNKFKKIQIYKTSEPEKPIEQPASVARILKFTELRR